MEILEFIGTCSSAEIGEFAEKNGKKISWNTAKRLIKQFDATLFNGLQLNLRTFYEDYTNVKTGVLFGVKGRYLHIIHSAIDYIFLIK